MHREIHLLVGPIAGVLLFAAMLLAGLTLPIAITASVTLLVAWWWVTEPIPIPATSLIPLAVFPLFGVIDAAQAERAYGSGAVQLMLGGFMLSAALEKSGAHRRIALMMVNACGRSSGRRLIAGFMLASAFLSMWISNAATTMMLLPIVLAVVQQSGNRSFQQAMILGVAYAASIGGIVTPIGTPPNIVFMEIYQQQTGEPVAFVQWMLIALPIAGVMLPAAWLWITRSVKSAVKIDLPETGQWRQEELRAVIVFAVIAFLWVTRQQPFGGWSALPGLRGGSDAVVALVGVVAMFLIPSGKPTEDGRVIRLLDWETAIKIPWGILVLFAGGICIAAAFGSSGLSELIGNSFRGLGGIPVLVLVGLICLAVTFLTELTSNTATATLLMPILAAIAVSNQLEPGMLMIPATISASFAFMLPVATPPNAIVFGAGQVSVREMAREGLILNLLGVLVVSLACCLI